MIDANKSYLAKCLINNFIITQEIMSLYIWLRRTIKYASPLVIERNLVDVNPMKAT